MIRLTLGVIAALMLLTASATAAAESADALSRGRDLVRAFEYDDAMAQLQSVVDDETATPSDRIQALELMALLQLNLRRQAQSRELFEQILNMDPGHELTDPEIPPRAREFYAEIKEEYVPSVGASLDVTLSDPEAPGGAVGMEATLNEGVLGAERVVAFVRSAGESAFGRTLLTRDGRTFSAHLPAPDPGTALEYYIEVQAPSGHVLTSEGSEESPLSHEVTLPVEEVPEEPDPNAGRRQWYRTWWFWTIVGAVVAGGATAGIVVGTRPEEHERGSLGSFQLP